MISVLVYTRNEERDLPGCLESVRWCDDVHVLDSGSTDGTRRVAEAHGARFTERSYDARLGAFGGDESAHRNWALGHLAFRHAWVLHLDADERVTPELAAALRAAVAAPSEHVAFRVRRRDIFLRTWLRHVQASPWYIRLFRPQRMRYERLINPVSVAQGPVGELAGFLDHYPFSKGIGHWVERHNAYSALEARQIVAGREPFSLRAALFERDFHRRRRQQKELFYRLPARPLAKFVLLYFAKRGFLDGRAGLTYATLQAIYEYLIVLKTRELRAPAER